ncbi:hypothetical protein E2F43_18455 [Seongchinamella unica]|uniref:Uncharacterized protein n=1 Tax=Seongchinamella unica TaxID=2547392 RepID=A0A4R5LMW6_9GAMM|nr:hypothetical protein [Seongchinamella unica]TDG11369.1 hypothetical protein E2F43_18455 [Seongchinamella unica]
MKNSLILFMGFVLALSISGGAFGKDKGGGKRYIFSLVGTATGELQEVPDPDNPGELMEANCFEFDLFEVKTRRELGTVVDCQTIQDVLGDFEFIRVVTTTTFNLPQGSITTQGLTTVAALQDGWPGVASPVVGPMTHFSAYYGEGSVVIGGTKRFKNATGISRLSGLANLDNMFTGNELTADCIFVVDID